jgi:diadenosine tetraphosphatase ApaH/serine/threonine PP2A family protein phosphatase
MRVAVISDIHGNLPALEAVLQAVDAERPDETWCLGDLVGYGPRPNECCDLVRRRVQICLRGNHDLGVLGLLDLADFSDAAAASALWTRGVLSDDARSYLDALESTGDRAGVGLFHASPRDPVWEYVLSADAAQAALAASDAPLVLVGHSHVPLVYCAEPEVWGHAPGGVELDFSEGRWLLNPGSVGQPRDGDPHAAFVLLDLEARRASFRRVPYDVETTQAEIREQGLPDELAERLAGGM